MKIAILLTCHNRRTKTERCLKSLVKAFHFYNESIVSGDSLSLRVFLTDDASTDGTTAAAQNILAGHIPLTVLSGDGNLFWAGGMRLCWKESLKMRKEWDYYLLINDDVELMANLFEELIATKAYSKKHYGQEGLCSGNTCWRDNLNKRSYGGRVWVSKFWATHKPLEPNGEPQKCDLVNANILLVPKYVVDRIGIFYEGYRHGNADYDYGIMASRAGIPVVISAHFCGIADNDHVCENLNIEEKIRKMSAKERKIYFSHPLRSSADYLCFVRRTAPFRYPFVWIGEKLRIYLPQLYYYMNKMR